MKIDLQTRKHPCGNTVSWKRSPPFALNQRGLLVHRVHSVQSHFWNGTRHHDAVHYWCGNGSTADHEFMDAPSENRLVCARCEAVAVLRGQPTSDELVGRHVCKGGVKTYRTCCTNEEQ